MISSPLPPPDHFRISWRNQDWKAFVALLVGIALFIFAQKTYTPEIERCVKESSMTQAFTPRPYLKMDASVSPEPKPSVLKQ